MEKRMIRRPILIAAAGIGGVLTLLAGYVESQAAAKFEFEFASVRPQPLSDDQVEASASTSIDRGSGRGAPVVAKAHRPAKVSDEHAGLTSSAARESWRRISVRSESTELPVDSHVAAEISRIQSNIPTHADIGSLKLLAGAAHERFALGLRVRVMRDGTVMPGHAEKSDGN
jgi:hypothetical protein